MGKGNDTHCLESSRSPVSLLLLTYFTDEETEAHSMPEQGFSLKLSPDPWWLNIL